jgi:hypothetical protein
MLILFTIGSVRSLLLQCNPVEAAWDFSLRPPSEYVEYYQREERCTLTVKGMRNATHKRLIEIPLCSTLVRTLLKFVWLQLTQRPSVQFGQRPCPRPHACAHDMENTDEYTH